MTTIVSGSRLALADFRFTHNWSLDLDGLKNEAGSPKYVIDRSTGRRYWNRCETDLRKDAIATATRGMLPLIGWSALFCLARLTKLATCYHFWCFMNRTKEVMVYSLSLSKDTVEKVQPDYYMQRKLSKEFSCTAIIEETVIDERCEVAEDAGYLADVDLGSPLALYSLTVLAVEDPLKEPPIDVNLKEVPVTFLDRARGQGCDLALLIATPINCLAMQFFSCYTIYSPTNNSRKLYQIFEELQFDGQRRVEDNLFAAMPPQDRFLPPPREVMS